MEIKDAREMGAALVHAQDFVVPEMECQTTPKRRATLYAAFDAAFDEAVRLARACRIAERKRKQMETREPVPACAASMGCLCAAHAACLNAPVCDASEPATPCACEDGEGCNS